MNRITVQFDPSLAQNEFLNFVAKLRADHWLVLSSFEIVLSIRIIQNELEVVHFEPQSRSY